MPSVRKLALSVIVIDAGTQSRERVDPHVVEDYADALGRRVDLDPVDVFTDGATTWLADGFHRYHSHAKAGRKQIEARVHAGTLRDAILFSLAANAKHGLRRTNGDKRRAVLRLLEDSEWRQWSDRAIAEHCGVGKDLVGAVRTEMGPQLSDSDSSARKGKDGKTRNTTPANQSRGGKASAAARKSTSPAAESDDPEDDGEVMPAAPPPRASEHACEACQVLIANHLIHCKGCGEHTSGAKARCEACGNDPRTEPAPTPLSAMQALAGGPLREIAALVSEAGRRLAALQASLDEAVKTKRIPDAWAAPLLSLPLESELRSLAAQFAEAAPAEACGYCKGTDPKCRGCRGALWMGKAALAKVPADVRANAAPHVALEVKAAS